VIKSNIILLIAVLCRMLCFAQSNSLFLSGSTNWVNAGNISVSGSNITVEALVHMTGSSVNIISKHSTTSNTNYVLRPQSFEITTSNGHAILVNPFTLQPNVTYHVAATYNGSMLRYYVNGCLTAESPWSGTLVTNSLATALGQQSTCQCEQFTGYMDEVRVWNSVRTEAQIRGNMYNIANPNLQTTLLAYFKFQGNFNNLANFAPAVTLIGIPTLQGLPYPYPSALALTQTASNVVCNNSETGAIDIHASGGIEPYEYSIDGVNFQSSPVFSNLPAGTYTIRVRSNANCVATTTRVIQSKPLINLNLNTENALCAGENNGSASVEPTGGNGPTFNAEWSNGETGNSISNLAPGDYSVTISDSCRVSGNELVNNGHFEQGTMGFTSDYNNCSDCYAFIGGELFENQFVVGVSASHHHQAFQGLGQGGVGNFMIVNGSSLPNTNVWCQTITVQPNTYYEFSAWVSSIVAQSPAQLQFQANGVLLGPVFTAPSSVNIWNQFFSVWFSGANTSVTICIINQNTATAGNDFGLDNISFKECKSCQVTQNFTINEPVALTATASAQNAVCGANNGSIDVSAQGGVAPYNYSVDGINYSTNNMLGGLALGMYTVYVRDASLCVIELQVTVGDDDEVSINAGDDVNVCAGQSVTLNATGSSGFVWSDNVQNGQAFVPNTSQYYYVEVDLGPTCYTIDSVFVNVWDLPVVNAGEDIVVCSGIPVVLNASGASTYVWSNSAINGQDFLPPVGNFVLTVTGTDANGCSNTDQLNLTVNQTPIVGLTADPVSGFVPLTVNFANTTGDNYDFSLSYGEGVPIAWTNLTSSYVYNASGLYWAVLSAESQECIGTDSVLITVMSANFDFTVPNVFSPNGDEVNPFFLLSNPTGYDQLEEFEMLILNRWGQVIQAFYEFDFEWNGRDLANNAMPEGVYFYKMHYRLTDGTVETLHGFVHLVLE
jgi:gliding motility-associated-like protein